VLSTGEPASHAAELRPKHSLKETGQPAEEFIVTILGASRMSGLNKEERKKSFFRYLACRRNKPSLCWTKVQ
jgi:hypothetical protein